MINRALDMALCHISSYVHLVGQLRSRVFRIARRHRVYMSFTHHASGWHCRFHKDDLAKTPISRLFVFRDAEKLYEAALRGKGFIGTESRQSLSAVIANGGGGLWLQLSDKQYAALTFPDKRVSAF